MAPWSGPRGRQRRGYTRRSPRRSRVLRGAFSGERPGARCPSRAERGRSRRSGTGDDSTGAILGLRQRPGEGLHGCTEVLRDVLLACVVPWAPHGDHTSSRCGGPTVWRAGPR